MTKELDVFDALKLMIEGKTVYHGVDKYKLENGRIKESQNGRGGLCLHLKSFIQEYSELKFTLVEEKPVCEKCNDTGVIEYWINSTEEKRETCPFCQTKKTKVMWQAILEYSDGIFEIWEQNLFPDKTVDKKVKVYCAEYDAKVYGWIKHIVEIEG